MTPQIPWKTILAEGLVIVVSILLAFGIDAWWDREVRLTDERQVLEQLAEGLRIDREQFQQRLDRHRAIEADIIALVDDLRDGPASDSIFERRIGSLTTWVGVSPNTAPYESLKSTGLELISNEGLRIALIRYYENRVPTLVNAYENDRDFVQEMVLPYAHANLRLRRNGTWAPIDLDVLRNDPYFANLGETKLQRLRERIITGYTAALTDIEDLLMGIEDRSAP